MFGISENATEDLLRKSNDATITKRTRNEREHTMLLFPFLPCSLFLVIIAFSFPHRLSLEMPYAVVCIALTAKEAERPSQC
jgi:Fe2+ transport system protein B